MTREEIKKKVYDISDLPTLPDVLIRTNKLLEDPDTLLADLTKVIEEDQSITSKILRIVNSAFYGFSGKIKTISQAVIILGFNTVRNIMVSLSIIGTFPKDGDLELFDPMKFWQHSVGCGTIAKFLGEKVGIDQPDEAFVAGLLHDLGKNIFAQFFKEDFFEALKMAYEKNILLFEAEEEVLGSNHALVGQYLGKRWRLPANLVDTIRFHHDPSHSKIDQDLTSIVHIADVICRGMGAGTGGDNSIPMIEEASWKRFDLKVELIEQWLPELGEKVEMANNLFSM